MRRLARGGDLAPGDFRALVCFGVRPGRAAGGPAVLGELGDVGVEPIQVHNQGRRRNVVLARRLRRAGCKVEQVLPRRGAGRTGRALAARESHGERSPVQISRRSPSESNRSPWRHNKLTSAIDGGQPRGRHIWSAPVKSPPAVRPTPPRQVLADGTARCTWHPGAGVVTASRELAAAGPEALKRYQQNTLAKTPSPMPAVGFSIDRLQSPVAALY